ncbi:hypothetical protein LU604_02265 [Erwinia tracheiphila]|uniref:hypothetical protein n=1 Tax=Erwinia tracheiphila TaxID=65700 RepID=UPI001F36AA0C|nr:hypothetical protein [Erwinia tracheiphila]UIA83948.1 hypothetical protein LU604_02265 [Erwinia tracheiphila]UIA92530.1 hypothetical protein LU632_02240 [Erwinia tracheiphila]
MGHGQYAEVGCGVQQRDIEPFFRAVDGRPQGGRGGYFAQVQIENRPPFPVTVLECGYIDVKTPAGGLCFLTERPVAVYHAVDCPGVINQPCGLYARRGPDV